MVGNIVEVTDNSFEQEVLESNLPVLVDFCSPGCSPCRSIAPVVEELAGDYATRLKVVKCNLADNPGLHRKYGIRGVPTLLVFTGGNVNAQITGAAPKSQITAAIDKIIDWTPASRHLDKV